VTKIVLVSADSSKFGTGMIGGIFPSAHLRNAEIVLNDINNAPADHTISMTHKFMKAHYLEQTLHVENDLRLALQGADFALISIEDWMPQYIFQRS